MAANKQEFSTILGADGKPIKYDAIVSDQGRNYSDEVLPGNMQHRPVADNAHISEKAYYFPPAFMALKQELEYYHKEWFETRNDNLNGKVSPAWAMMFNASDFVMIMNQYTLAAVDLNIPDATEAELQAAANKAYIPFDTGAVNWTCHQFLNRLRKMRGVSPLSY